MEVINEDDQMSNAKTSKLSDSGSAPSRAIYSSKSSFNSILASDEGFNSGNQSSGEPEERKRERRRNNRDG